MLDESKSVWALLSAGALAGAGSLLWGYLRNGTEGIGVVGSVASVVSLLLTGYVALKVRRIRSRYVRQIMLGKCHLRLTAVRQQLELALRKGNVDRVREQLSQLSAILREVSRHEGSARRIEWDVPDIRAVIRSDARLLVPRTRGLLAEVDQRVEALGFALEELNWGTDHE